MYCPVCFNQTLKIASSGVVRVTFNQKSRNTNQFFYDLKKDKTSDLIKKFREVVVDYFSWYGTFQNKGAIKEVTLTSIDFVCSNGCKMNNSCRMTVVDLVLNKEEIKKILDEEGKKFDIPVTIS